VPEESRQQCPRHDDALNLIGALVDLVILASEARHFEAAEMNPNPASPHAAAEYTINRAASTFIAMPA
jgi:hypothetical protein